MKKVYKILDLDCANCAAKIEREVKKLDGVFDASVNFMTGKLSIDIEDENADNIIKSVVKVFEKVEPDCTVVL